MWSKLTGVPPRPLGERKVLRMAHAHFSASPQAKDKQIALLKRAVSGQQETPLATPLIYIYFGGGGGGGLYVIP